MADVPLADAATAQPRRPGKQSIAFASSVVLSKPDNLSIQDYIRHLRGHIAKGRRESALSSTYRYLDRSSYWRSEYERTKDALKKSEAETIDLRREIDELKVKLDAAKPAAPARKRKKVDADVIVVPRSPKKPRRDVSPARKAGESTTEDHDFSVLGEVGSNLMRGLYQTHAALQTHNRVESAVLAHHLIHIASALPQVVHHLVKQRSSGTLVDIDPMKATLLAASRAITAMFIGIDRLSYAEDGAEVQGSVIYAYVQIFLKLLNALEKASAHELECGVKEEDTVAAGKDSSASQSKTKSKRPKTVKVKDNPTLSTLTTFLLTIIDLLNTKTEARQSLFEGFAYCILDKLGAKLYLTTFGHARGSTIEDEIAASNRRDDIDNAGATASEQPMQEGMDLRQARLEAPYLIQLLTRIMSLAPTYLGATMSKTKTKAKQANNKSSIKGALAISAKERLQRTLVHCIFGTEGVDENDPFRDFLRMPTAIQAPPPPMPKVKETDVQEWFKEEMWRVLGWEILAKEGEW